MLKSYVIRDYNNLYFFLIHIFMSEYSIIFHLKFWRHWKLKFFGNWVCNYRNN